MWPGGALAPKCQLLNPYPCIFGVMAFSKKREVFPLITNIYHVYDIYG